MIADAITKKDVGTQVDSRSDDGTIQREASYVGSKPKSLSCEDSGCKKTEVLNNSLLLDLGNVNSGNVQHCIQIQGR